MVYQLKRTQTNKRPQAFWGSLIPSALSFVGGLITSSQQAKAQRRALEEQQRLAKQQLDISNQNQLATTLNNYAIAQQSYDDKDYNLKYRIGGVRRLGGRNIIITDGGNAKRIGNNTYLLRGGSHEDINETGQTGIGINVGGNEIEAEGGEVAQRKGNSLRIYSAQPILGGMSPAQAIMRGYNKDKVFNAQQRFKKNNGIKDDGSKAQVGGYYGANYPSPLSLLSILYDKTLGRFDDKNPNLQTGIAPTPSRSLNLKQVRGGLVTKNMLPTNRVYRITNMREVKDAKAVGQYRALPDGVTLPSRKVTTRRGLTFNFGKAYGNSHGGKAASMGQPWTGTTSGGYNESRYVISTPSRHTVWRVGHHGNYSKPLPADAIKKGSGVWKKFNDEGNTGISTKRMTVYKELGNGRYLRLPKSKYRLGGGLTSKDRGSSKHPYPSVSSKDFAGGGRSYPIPTKADAIDALRLAGLHGRNDVRSKVYSKYPELRKKAGDNRPKALDGDEFTPIKGGYYPKSDEQRITNWMSYWLNHRRKQLYNNMKKISIRNEDAGSWLGNGRPEFTFKLIKGMSPERRKINGVFYNQINRAANATIDEFNTISNPNYLGEFDEDGKLIRYNIKNKKFNNGVRVHERTHASDAYPQYKAIEDILKKGKVNFPNSEFIDDEVKHYHTDPNEIYSRIMQYRYNNKLKPNQVVDKKYINSHRKQLKDLDLNIFDDITLSKFFNEVADNGKRNNTNSTYIARFGTYFNNNTKHIAKRMGGITNPPVERFKCGGHIRPKAEKGMLAPIYSYGTNKRRLPSFAPIDVTPRAIPNFKFVSAPNTKTPFNPNDVPFLGRQSSFKPATQDYIGLGIDTLAALGSGMFIRSAYNKMNFDYALPNYVDESPVAFDTTYHNEAQQANIERNRLNARNLIRGNTASAQTSLGRMQQSDVDAMMETNKLLDEKSNKEVELRNQNAANEQQVRARNAAARNQYYQNVAQIKNAAIEAKNNMELARAQSIGADLSGLSQAWTNFAGSVEQRYDNKQKEAIIAATAKDPAVLSNAVQFGYNFSPEVLAAIYNSTDDDNLKSLALSQLSTKNRLRYGIR